MVRNVGHFILLSFIVLFSCENSSGEAASENNEPATNPDWSLVWADEFETASLDQNRWNILRWRPGWVNNELQAYTNRDTNLYLEDGSLVIRGIIEPGYFDTDYQGNEYSSDYTSGRINTAGKYSTTYGRFDIRAKLPKGRGSWPAIWMLGENISSIGWPKCGEIDIMEHVGYDDDGIHGSIHTETFNHAMNTQKSGSTTVPTATDSFHIYSLEWTPNYLRYLVDDESFFFVYNNSGGDISQWPFDSPHYLILNLALGGDWGGVQGIDPTKFPMKMLIDYVRVYKKSETNNDVSVTFNVDMKNVTTNGTGVWLSGGDLGSGQPGGMQMTPTSETDIWSISLSLPKNSTFTYKFRNGYLPDTWSGGWETVPSECGVGQHNDRVINTSSEDIVISSVCFNRCQECE
tara:strand:+ start:6878 stop:8089 length:1212 start_codon:yes stop_codon:yes gene_type:complete